MSTKQNAPHVREEQAGKKAWCACGESKNQPYCDGTHRTVGHPGPMVVELQEGKTVAWCGCKESKNKPFCDGSHRTLPPKS